MLKISQKAKLLTEKVGIIFQLLWFSSFLLSRQPDQQDHQPNALTVFSTKSSSKELINIIPQSCFLGGGWESETGHRRSVHPNSLSTVTLCSSTAHLMWFSCHPALKRTLFVIQQYFWWTSMLKDTTEYVSVYPVCARYKGSNKTVAGLLRPLPVPSHPWSHISLDSVTGLRWQYNHPNSIKQVF